ncbi:MAG: NADH-quinone oxidoreductase subunit NuoE [Dehalococcoidales bacterium]|nr:NADH-quinone oxidoreductase subunit NuoE [Dehalococcoidales bacterium]
MPNKAIAEKGPEPVAIDAIIHRHNLERGAVIPILQEIQQTYGYVSKAAIQRIAENINVSASEIFGIVTFYAQFRLEPLGKNLIKVCHGTACHLSGADMVTDTLAQVTGAKEGETSQDGLFTIERVACLGCCSLAPVMMVNGEVHGRLTPERVSKIIKNIRKNETTSPAE